MTAPLRILLVTETLVTGGAETIVLRLARRLRALGHHAELLNLNRDLQESELVEQFGDIRIHQVPLPMVRKIEAFVHPCCAKGLRGSDRTALDRSCEYCC